MNDIWLGNLDGDVLVFDPSFQLPDCPHLFLWDARQREMSKYLADATRPLIKPHIRGVAEEDYIALYSDWRSKKGDEWLAKQISFYEEQRRRQLKKLEEDRLRREQAEREAMAKVEAERFAALSTVDRHREVMERIGKEYRGVRPASDNPRWHRVTHCYSCHRTLDNSVDVECVACGWILCTCGACGCGYGL